ncbi:MAG: EpsI family protein, partial [Gammaproteobacteria bacterium]|nr:EpsI family protein [Gammaproteobacteria bacterium]
LSLGLIGLLYWQSLASIGLHWWNTSDYEHGLIIFPACLYLAWTKRDRLAALRPRSSLLGVLFLAGASLFWWLSEIAGVQVGQQLAVVALVFGAVFALTGWPIARLLAFPIAYILCVIPVWNLLIPILQANTARMSTWMLHLIGVPVYLDGFHMSIPNGSFVVADICAGMRFLLASLAIGALFSHQNYQSVWRGAAFLLFAVAVAVVFNWMRVAAIVTAGYYLGMEHWTVEEHLYVGWFMFALALIPMFAVGELIGRGDRSRRPAAETGSEEPSAPGPSTPSRRAVAASRSVSLMMSGLIPVLVLVAAGPMWALWEARQGSDDRVVELAPLDPINGWRLVPGGAEIGASWSPEVSGAHATRLSTYIQDGFEIGVYRAYFKRQRQGAEVVSDGHVFFDTERWDKPKAIRAVAPGVPGIPTVTETSLAAPNGRNRVLWRIDQVGGKVVGDPYMAKLYEVLGRVRGRTQAQVVVLACDYTGELSEARRHMTDFLVRAWPQLGVPRPTS